MSRHPMAANWLATLLVTILFTPENPNRTLATVSMEIFAEANADERKAFSEAKMGMTQGWTGAFNQLEQLIFTH